jgi:aspartate-semialdehyde dehydrogenase
VDCGRFGKVTVEPFSVAAAQECALVLLAVSGSFATKFAREISGGPNNTVVIDNSSAFRCVLCPHIHNPTNYRENGRHSVVFLGGCLWLCTSMCVVCASGDAGTWD